MVNIFGWRLAKIKSLEGKELTCEKCGQAGGVTIDVYQEYLHAFWIPMFPSGRKVVAQCSKCGAAHWQDKMPATYSSTVAKAKAQATTPVWTFVGLPILLIGIGYSYWGKMGNSALDDSAKVQTCLTQLAPKQIYELNMGPPSYSPKEVKKLIRIETMDGNTVSYSSGLMQRHLDQNLIGVQGSEIFDNKIQTVTVDNFKKLPLLNCK